MALGDKTTTLSIKSIGWRPNAYATPAALVIPVIEISLAGAVVHVVPGLDDAQLTTVLRAVRASALRR